MNRPGLLRDRRLEIALGLAMFIGGGLLLRDAYEVRRGPGATPWALRPFTWW